MNGFCYITSTLANTKRKTNIKCTINSHTKGFWSIVVLLQWLQILQNSHQKSNDGNDGRSRLKQLTVPYINGSV